MTTSHAIVVEHATQSPGLDAMVAAELARRLLELLAQPRTLRCVRVRPEKDFPEEASKEYVAAYGSLLANGFFWIERAVDQAIDPSADEIVGMNNPPAVPQIISINPWLFANPRRPDIEEALRNRTAGALWVRVFDAGEGFECDLLASGGSAGLRLGRVSLDLYGRPRSDFDLAALRHLLDHLCLPSAADRRSQGSTNVRTKKQGPRPRVILIGEDAHFRSIYPPVLASLGDAADHLDLEPTIDILSAHEVATVEGHRRIREGDGLLLPGGVDMSQTEGQIEAATLALNARIPTLGLCLGMQTMTLAVARDRAGLKGCDLEEVKPNAPCLIFRRLRSVTGDPVHRLGLHESVVSPGTRLAAIFSDGLLSERMNHRYHLDPAWLPNLETAGLRVAATSKDGLTVDAVEYPGHPFFLGLQGHPEMSSRLGRPHRAIAAFLASAARQRAYL